MRPVSVSDEDVTALLLPFKPGSEHRSDRLYERYSRLMTDAGRPVATRTALGRALTRNGCKRRVVRQGRGRRGAQTRTDTPVWTLPTKDGSAPDDALTILALDFGPGLHPVDLVYRRYLGMPGIAVPITRNALMAQMARRGCPTVRDRRVGQTGQGPLCLLF